jgi:sodium pump decarboxylase gamma subunit
MKQNIRRIIAVLCMAVCLLGLTACGAGEAETKDSLDPMEAAQVNQDAQEWLSIIVSVTPEDAEEKQAGFKEANLNGVAEAIAAWINVSGDTGDLVQVDNAVAEKTEDGGYTSTMRAQFENRPVEVKIFYEIQNNVLTPVSVSIAPEYTTGENMARAAMNTLMGMGTVFLVLIFISLIINCFKYINAFEQKMKAAPRAAAPAPAPAAVVAPAASQPQEELVDDLELVAVITAAIAAATGSSADGLVVRSIRRAPGAKWKRA